MDLLNYQYELLIGSLVLNIILSICLLSPDIARYVNKQHLDWKIQNHEKKDIT
jgi:hypothetical protein